MSTKLLITREQFKAVLALTSEKSIKAIKAASDNRVIEIRYRAQELLADEHKITCFQYVRAEKQRGAAHLYRRALEATIKLCNETLKGREDVSPLVDEVVNAPEVEELAAVGADSNEYPSFPGADATASDEEDDDLPF